MRAGNLDRVIVIERATTALDTFGVPRSTWSAVVTMRAQLVEANADEFIRQGVGQLTERTVLFRTRFLDGVTVADRVTYDGRIYNVTGIKEIGRRNGLEIRARALGAP